MTVKKQKNKKLVYWISSMVMFINILLGTPDQLSQTVQWLNCFNGLLLLQIRIGEVLNKNDKDEEVTKKAKE